MVIVRSGVGVNYREPPDEIGRVGLSDVHVNNNITVSIMEIGGQGLILIKAY